MEETSEKIPIALAGPEDLQQFMPPVSLHIYPLISFLLLLSFSIQV